MSLNYDIKTINDIATDIEGVFNLPLFDEIENFNLKVIWHIMYVSILSNQSKI